MASPEMKSSGTDTDLDLPRVVGELLVASGMEFRKDDSMIQKIVKKVEDEVPGEKKRVQQLGVSQPTSMTTIIRNVFVRMLSRMAAL